MLRYSARIVAKTVHHPKVHSTSYTVLDDRTSIPLNVRRGGWGRIISTLQQNISQTSRKHLVTCFHDVYLMLTNVCPRPTSFLFVWEVWISPPQNLASEHKDTHRLALSDVLFRPMFREGYLLVVRGDFCFLRRLCVSDVGLRAASTNEEGNNVQNERRQYDVRSLYACRHPQISLPADAR